MGRQGGEWDKEREEGEIGREGERRERKGEREGDREREGERERKFRVTYVAATEDTSLYVTLFTYENTNVFRTKVVCYGTPVRKPFSVKIRKRRVTLEHR